MSIRGWGVGLAAAVLAGALPAAAGDGFVALRVSSPLMVSASAGMRLGADDPARLEPAAEVEAGIGGGRILVGIDHLGAGFGLGLKAVFLRTWLEPVGVDEDQSYIGVVGQMGFDRLFGELGLYGRIEGDDDSTLVSFALGVRL